MSISREGANEELAGKLWEWPNKVLEKWEVEVLMSLVSLGLAIDLYWCECFCSCGSIVDLRRSSVARQGIIGCRRSCQ